MASKSKPLPDLTECDHEPITRLDRIQNFGFLVALSNDWTVVRASANLDTHLGIDALSAIGGNFSLIVDAGAQAAIRNRMAMLYSTGNERLFGIRLTDGRPLFDLNLHFVDDILVIEGEPSVSNDDVNDAASMVRSMMAQLGATEDLDRFQRMAARQVRDITGFDRVMVYRFDDVGNGEVVAEATGPRIESFLGLHYPASDIPQQARALYLRNPFRIISDVGETSVTLLPAVTTHVPPLDLSQAITRAVSPVHIEYLTNMGVGATLSISIIVDDALWGLFACHHYAPRLPSFVMRTAAELFGGMYSLALESRLGRAGSVIERRARVLTDKLIAGIAANEDLLSDPQWLDVMMSEMVAYDGIAIYRAGQVLSMGHAPTDAEISALAQHLALTSPSRVFATDQLTSLSASGMPDPADAAGMLAIPISRTPRDYILLFRREWLQSIRWGGEPVKVSAREDGFRLSPRKSFAAFSETIRGKSRPFGQADYRIGEALRSAVVEVILHLSAIRIEALAAEITARRDIEREVFGLNETFEAKVLERTHQLVAANGKLAKKIIKGDAALKSSRADVGLGLADLLASETALGDSEHTNAALTVANEVLVINEAALEKLVAKRTAALLAEINTRRIMATAIAHELNQPLAAISGFLGGMSLLAGRGDLTPETLAKIVDASRQAASQAVRAGDILKLLRNSITRDDSVRTDEDIGIIIEDAIALAVTNGGGLDVTFKFNHSPDHMIATVNRTQIRQVLSNLIQNAIEAVNDVDIHEVTVTLRHDTGSGMLSVDVADTGPGVAPEMAKGLFMPFLSSKPHGMGIGLSISREIVEEHHGKLTSRSNPGGGAIFSVALPLRELQVAA